MISRVSSSDLFLKVLAFVTKEVSRALQLKVRPYARGDDSRPYWLGDVVYGTHLEAGLLILFFGARGDEDHGNVHRLWILLQSLADLVAVHHGHRHIQENKIGRTF